jgi:hypothetical protein
VIAALVLALAFAASVAGFAAAKSTRARALFLLPQPALLVLLIRAAVSLFELPRDAPALAVVAAAATAACATGVTLLFALRGRRAFEVPGAGEPAQRAPLSGSRSAS